MKMEMKQRSSRCEYYDKDLYLSGQSIIIAYSVFYSQWSSGYLAHWGLPASRIIINLLGSLNILSRFLLLSNPKDLLQIKKRFLFLTLIPDDNIFLRFRWGCLTLDPCKHYSTNFLEIYTPSLVTYILTHRCLYTFRFIYYVFLFTHLKPGFKVQRFRH